jgi:hypothetical protein
MKNDFSVTSFTNVPDLLSFRLAYLVGKDMLLFAAGLFEGIKLQVQFLARS